MMSFLQSRGASGGTSGLMPNSEVEITHDTRTRSLIVKASKSYILIMDQIVKQLDADSTEAKSTYVVRLRNNDAYTLAETIRNLVGGSRGRTGSLQNRSGTNGSTFGRGQDPRGNNSNQRSSSPSTRSGVNSSMRSRSGRNLGPLDPGQDGAPPPAGIPQEQPRSGIEGDLQVEADPSTNSLIFRTSPRNFASIQEMLKELDRTRPQVLIKVLIADVTLDESTQFGIEGFWENRMTVRGGDSATTRVGTEFAQATQGFSYLLSGDEFQASLNMFAREGKLRILATPRILALDNETAYIRVGKEVPRVTFTTINQLGNQVNTVEYEPLGILLEVTPLINPDGLVTMRIIPEISDVASDSEAVEISPGVFNPTFNVNRAETTVAVRTGTTVVIGGLIRETLDDSVQKVPFFGDLPLIGPLFSSTTQRKIKRELMIFLTPYAAYSSADLEEITEIERAKLKLIDPRDIEAEGDRWLEKIRR